MDGSFAECSVEDKPVYCMRNVTKTMSMTSLFDAPPAGPNTHGRSRPSAFAGSAANAFVGSAGPPSFGFQGVLIPRLTSRWPGAPVPATQPGTYAPPVTPGALAWLRNKTSAILATALEPKWLRSKLLLLLSFVWS